jgi:hypothetical protein
MEYVTVWDCVIQSNRSLIKARRLYLKRRGWKDKDWYDNWPMTDEWEKAAERLSQESKVS